MPLPGFFAASMAASSTVPLDKARAGAALLVNSARMSARSPATTSLSTGLAAMTEKASRAPRTWRNSSMVSEADASGPPMRRSKIR